MKKMRILCALMALVLLCQAVPALAARKVSVRFGVKAGLVYVGASGTLKPALTGVKRSALRWKSSNKSVVSVSGGRVKARKAGLAVITASSGGASARVGVVVLPRTVKLRAGTAVNLPHGGIEDYLSADSDIAAVSPTGVIVGKSAGVTDVLVSSGRQNLVVTVTVTGTAQSPQPSTPSVPDATGQSRAAKLDCAATASQIVLVEHKSGSKATLSVHEKKNGVWTELYSCAAYIGKNGLGKTVAGDKKTPVGTYNLTTPFGIKDDPGSRMPYLKVTKYHYWCGASNSGYYNQLVDTRVVNRPVSSSDEYLINYKGVYNYCMFIDYNAAGVAHKGSCIFLHCTGKNKYTSGCVAIPEATMKKIIQWAAPGCKIVIN